MKRLIALIVTLICVLSLFACGHKNIEVTNIIEGNIRTYYEMSDGSWECDGHIYKFKLEISGRMPNAAVDSTFVYLSNQETISFDQAYKAAGVSSNLDDYFAVEDAVLVDWITNTKPSEQEVIVENSLIPMVMIDGFIYVDIGEESTRTEREYGFDGEITSTVTHNQEPTENNQSNFGTGYGYQYGPNGTIEILMNDKWWVFVERAYAV